MADSNRNQLYTLERPRLLDVLDSLETRIALITAPAGYGKTTLARQWAASRADVAWYRTRAASRDVSSLALGIAVSFGVAPAEEARLRAQIKALPRPDEHAGELADTLASILRSIQGRAATTTLVIDDNDVINSSSDASTFVQTLAEIAPLRLLLVGRERPSWVATRHILYGEVSEIDRQALAFTVDEAAELLGVGLHAARSLWDMARGWPAVMRLASITGVSGVPMSAIGTSLHEYFAEELYDGASTELRDRLPYLALLLSIPQPVLELICGDLSTPLQAEATQRGFMAATDQGVLEMHPLIRGFVRQKAAKATDRKKCEEILRGLLILGEWDNGFAVVEAAHLDHELPALIFESMDDLLNEGRLRTLSDWLAFAREESILTPEIALLEAELARRSGLLTLAHIHALKAAESFQLSDHEWASRAFALAGICAHSSQASEKAVTCFRNARSSARTTRDVRNAIWGELVTSHALEDARSAALLSEYEQHVEGDPDARVRLATGRFIVARGPGSGPLEATIRDYLAPHLSLCVHVRDPLVTSSLYYQLGYGYALVGRYRQALDVITRGEEEVRTLRLAFAEAHLAAARVAATIGLRRFSRADTLIDSLLSLAEARGNTYELSNALGLRARLMLSMGLPREATEELVGWREAPVVASLRAELGALRALALAQTVKLDDADALAAEVMLLSQDAQPRTAALAARAVVELRTGHGHHGADMGDFESVLLERENYDCLVHAYRAHPPLLKELWERERVPRRRLIDLIVDAHDRELAKRAGIRLPRVSAPMSSLSSRESEVLDLIRQGMTNNEIAASLFISPSTVKVHVKHILEKLGARSRTEAVTRVQDA